MMILILIKTCVRTIFDVQKEDNRIDSLVKFNEIFSRFKDDPDVDFINVNRLTEVLQAFGRNPSLRDSEERINDLEMAGENFDF